MNPGCTDEVDGSLGFVLSREQSWAYPSDVCAIWLIGPGDCTVKLEMLELTGALPL